MSIVALRNAVALQRYKEIQLANDVDYQSQIEAHFGIKPNDKDENSLFIGGASSMLNINEQINQNFATGGKATYCAAPQGNGSADVKFTAKTYGVVLAFIVVHLFSTSLILVLTVPSLKRMHLIFLFLN